MRIHEAKERTGYRRILRWVGVSFSCLLFTAGLTGIFLTDLIASGATLEVLDKRASVASMFIGLFGLVLTGAGLWAQLRRKHNAVEPADALTTEPTASIEPPQHSRHLFLNHINQLRLITGDPSNDQLSELSGLPILAIERLMNYPPNQLPDWDECIAPFLGAFRKLVETKGISNSDLILGTMDTWRMAYESANAGSRPRNPLTPFAAASDMEPLIIGGQLPVKVNFTGRAGEVLRLRHVLACRHDAPTCLVGQGGTGKTQIAREYIRRFESIYEVIWWVRAEDPSLINASLASLASQLNLDITDPHFRQVLFDTLRSPEHTGRWLIVYDNVEDPSSITPFLPLGGGDVLITTRDRRWIQAGYIIEIDSFSRADSVAVILDRAPHLSEIESQLISDKVGDLPIAVVQAATYIAETGISAPEYMRLLDERTAEILDEGLPADYQASLTSTWLLSLDHLAKTCPPAVSLLHRCAFFGAESIPRELLKEGALPLAGDSAEVFRDPLMLGVAIRELQRFGLMRMDAGELRLQMHRLLRSLLRQKMSKRLRQSCRHDVHLLLVGAYKSKSMESNNDPILSQIVGHAHASQLNRCSNSAAKTLSGVLDQYLQSPTADEIRTTSRQWHPSSAGTSILINLEDSDWLRLTKQLARGDCFPIFGPDSSKQYQDALRSVSKRIAHECGYPGNDVTALPYVAEYASMSMPSRSDFGHYVANLIREELQDDPTEIQRLLSSFPIDSYFIETFDGSLKRGLEEAGRIPATRISDLFDELWGRGTAIENPTPERPLIFHYMGAYSAPETMILRYSDHVNLRFREAESEWVGQHHWPIHIRSSISSRPLLFIGPAIWSPHGILEGAARRIPRSNRRRHIFVIDSSTIDTSNASRDQLVDLVMSRLPGDWSASLFIGSIDSFAAELRARLESQQSSNQSA